MSKKRLLFVGEASYLATGFSTYWNEVIKRINATGRFEVAEFGSYASDSDPRNQCVPWKFYPNAPDPNDQVANQAYHSRQTNQFGEWRFSDVLLDWKPDCVCVPPGTNIETPRGPVPIENIKVGDYVISHKGVPRRVTKTMRRQHVGDISNIYIFGDNRTYRLTNEHPVLVIRSKKRTWKERDVRQRHFAKDAEFIPASKVGVNDYVVIPIYSGHKIDNINLKNHLSQFVELDNRLYPVGHRDCTDFSLPSQLDITQDLARFLGYYCAEGSVNRGSIELCFGFYENKFVDDVLSLGKELFGLTGVATANRDRGNRTVRFCSILLSKFMESICGRGAHNKVVPDCIYQNNNCDIVKGFLTGFIRGDGTYKYDTVSATTVSKIMAHQIRQLSLRIGVRTSIKFRKNKGSKLVPGTGPSYDIDAYGGHARNMHRIVQKHEELPTRILDDPKHLDKAGKGWIDENYLLLPVRRIRKTQYRGQVYNLEVEEDNSYVTGFAVHNCQIRDFWMDEFVLRSPLRSNFKVIWMPTIDGAPQRKLWVDTYKQCDAIMTYSQWGKDLLEKEYDIRVTAVASPGAELDLFKPVPDKGAHKAKHGIDPSSFIIGTVMRNQKRKLYVDLIEAFAEWLRSSKKSSHLDIAKKTYLYLHTSYPDVGYDIGDAIQKFKVGNKVLMTYLCSACGTAYPSFFSGEWAHCRRCGKLAAHPPNANHSVGRDVLASIYNIFDVYVQYSICLHPDTPILLSDYTHKRIADIKSGDQIVNGNGDVVKVNWCKQTNDTSSTVEIKTYENDKPVIVTHDHRVLTMNENNELVFLEAKDLQDKWVVCPINNAKIFDAIGVCNPKRNSKHRKKHKNYLLIKVKSVKQSNYTGPVYDLAVVSPKGGDANSRSFVANHFVTHNCEG